MIYLCCGKQESPVETGRPLRLALFLWAVNDFQRDGLRYIAYEAIPAP